MVYLHDGTLDGFLTCIYHHYYTHAVEGIYEARVYEPVLLQEVKFIETEETYASRVHDAMIDKFSEAMYGDIYRTFLSNAYEKDTYLLAYLKLAFKMGYDTERLRSNEDVYQVQKLSHQVGFEAHRFMGLIRFSDVGGGLYAPFRPDNNLVTLLADHFADRLKEERFIMHDVGRKLAVVCDRGQWLLTDFDQVPDKALSKEEMLFRNLWKGYFETIGIEGRKNLKLQQSFVPLKYRQHLVEFN